MDELTTEELYQKYQNAADMADNGDELAARDARIMGDELRRRQNIAAGGDGSSVEPGGFGQTNLGQAMGGMTEALGAGTLGLPAAALNTVTDVANLPLRGINKVGEWFGAEEDLVNVPPRPFQPGDPGTYDYYVDAFRDPDSLYARTVGGPASVAPDPDSPTWHRAGELAGAGIGMVTGMGRAGNPVAARQTGGLADTLATQVAKPGAVVTIPAVEGALGVTAAAGGDLAAAIGGEEWRGTGEMIGGAGPAVTGAALQRGTSAVLGDVDSAARYKAAKAINAPATPGLVGNDAARLAENVAGINPLASRMVKNKQGQQVQATSDALDRVTTQMREEGLAPGNDPYSAGSRISETIERVDPITGDRSGILPDLEKELTRLERVEANAVGGDAQGLNVDRVLATLDRQIARVDAQTADDLRYQRDQLLRDKTTPVDQQLHDQITRRMTGRQQRLEQLEAKKNRTPTENKAMYNLRTRIKKDQEQIEANMGVSQSKINTWRKNVGQGTQGRNRVDAGLKKELYASGRASQRAMADKLGNLDTFNKTVAEKRRIAGKPGLDKGGEMDFLRTLASKEPEQVYRAVTAKDAAGRISALKRTMPVEKFNTMASDILTILAKPKSQQAHASDLTTETFSPAELGTNWRNLPDETKKLLIPNKGIRDELDTVLTMSQATVQRGRNANTSNTANFLGTGMFGAGLMTAPVTTTATATGGALATKAFLSDAVAAVIAKQYPEFAEQFARRGTATVGQQTIGQERDR